MNSIAKAKIKWQCRRGMLELDLLLERFIANELDDLNASQLDQLRNLLEASDPDLYAWLMGFAQPINKELLPIVEHVRASAYLK